jgi:hypothetical protein
MHRQQAAIVEQQEVATACAGGFGCSIAYAAYTSVVM